MTELPKLADYPAHDYDKLRYSDMDTQGHVNNAVFTTLLETGRTSLLNHPTINAWNRLGVALRFAPLTLRAPSPPRPVDA